MHRPLGIIFDLGDTVIRLGSVDALEGNRRMLEYADYNPGVTAEKAAAFAEEVFSFIDYESNARMLEVPASSIDRLIFETLGVTFRIGYEELERVFLNGALTYSPVEGIFKLLDTLDSLGIKTGILSNSINSANILVELLDKHGLADRFSFLISSADYGVCKPHGYIFGVAIRKMGLPPSDIWFVGDEIEFDIRGALDAGLYPVWYNWHHEPASLDGEFLEVRSMRELREKVESLHNTE